MPSETPKQQRFMRTVAAYKGGSLREVSPEVRKAARSMTEREVRDFTKLRDGGRLKRKARR